MPIAEKSSETIDHDVVIIGAGFAGLGMAIRLEQSGRGDYVVLERGADVGGTWRDNTYPGCACDVPSNLYSFSFALNPDWTRSFSPQPEIHAYLQRCAVDFDVSAKIRFDHAVREARWDRTTSRWIITTDHALFRARVVVSGTGPLSEPKVPDIPGRDDFAGPAFHTGAWDSSVDLTGKRVAVIGTGASSIQVVPQIAKTAARVDVYQRTAPWVIPRTDRKISGAEHFIYRHIPGAQRLVRASIYWTREIYVVGLAKRPRAMAIVARIARRHLQRQVPDPERRAELTPNFTIGCKRILISNDYYPAMSRPNVALITEGITEVTSGGIVDATGTVRDIDVIIYGTGFHVTDLPTARYIFGADGNALSEVWARGMEAYLGSTVAGFPNLFFLVGPNSGLAHSSMVLMIEAQVAYVLDALRQMELEQIDVVEVRQDVQQAFNDDVQRLLRNSVWNTGGCASWYLDARGRNTTLWPTYTFSFMQRTRHFDLNDYRAVRAPRDRKVDEPV